MRVHIGPYKDDGSERKVEVHIHNYDTWNMDGTLAHIVLPMLKQLKETKHGAPNVDDDDVPKELQAKYADEKGDPNFGMTDSNWFLRWDYVMDEMIFAFQSVHDDWEQQFYNKEQPEEVADEDEEVFKFVGIGPAQLRLFPDENGETEDYEYYEMKNTRPDRIDWDAYRQYADRIQNGFRLFGKYFQSLWD